MNNPNARDRILQAALECFAAKSYEGARMDEIAKTAQIPKSLIYYHFKSKEEIFNTLINSFVEEYSQIIHQIDETDTEKSQRLQERVKTIYYNFGKRNEDLVRIIFIDCLKKNSNGSAIFKLLDALFSKVAVNTDRQQQSKRMVAEFFTSIIPSYAYICFGDAFCKYYNLDREELNKYYLEAYNLTHGLYHDYIGKGEAK